MITLLTVAFFLLSCHAALAEFITGPDQLTAEGAHFSWEEAKSRTIKIFVEAKAREGNLKRADIGSGFLVSPDGLFVTAYHVMKYCLQSQKEASGFSVAVDCSATQSLSSLPVGGLRYKAQNDDHEFGIQILSHLKEKDSTAGKNFHTPDEIIK